MMILLTAKSCKPDVIQKFPNNSSYDFLTTELQTSEPGIKAASPDPKAGIYLIGKYLSIYGIAPTDTLGGSMACL